MLQRGSRSEFARIKVLETLSTVACPMSTTQVSDVVRTPYEFRHTVPDGEFIFGTDVYRALVALEKKGRVIRLPRLGSRDQVWWALVGTEVEAVPELPEWGFNEEFERLVAELENGGAAQC